MLGMPTPEITQQIVESWEINNRINLFLIDAVEQEWLEAKSASGGRTAGEQFAHIHNVRLMWLKAADPQLLTGLEKLDKGGLTKEILRASLVKSSEAVATLLGNALTRDGRVKNFKPHAVAFFGYLVSHESHHRGQITLTMKQAGHPLDKKTLYGLWEWGTR
jgi:uncharacterized damage-inducible protein DinB